MQVRRAPFVLSAWLCAAAAATAGCGTHDNAPLVGPATFTYTCCLASDLAGVHPGGVLTLHWIVEAGPPAPSATALPVTLSASLAGPFGAVDDPKRSVSAAEPSPELTTGPLQTTDHAGGAPVSTIAIPAETHPGFYNLTTVIDYAGATLSGGSIVQIEDGAGS